MKNKSNTTHNNNGNGRRTVEPVAPAAFTPPPPTFPTVTLYFENLPSVALVIPDPTNLTQLIAIGAEVSRQLSMKALGIVAEQVAKQQQPERVLGPDESAPVD